MGNALNSHSHTPDEKIRACIVALFAKDDHTSYASLRVGVNNGIVHLAGVVSSIEARITAAEIAGGVEGVRGVVNRIEAPGAPSSARTVNLNLEKSSGYPYEEKFFPHDYTKPVTGGGTGGIADSDDSHH